MQEIIITAVTEGSFLLGSIMALFAETSFPEWLKHMIRTIRIKRHLESSENNDVISSLSVDTQVILKQCMELFDYCGRTPYVAKGD